MNGKMRVFVLIAAALGVLRLTAAGLNWTWARPDLFVLYLVMAVICGCLRLPTVGAGRAFSLNLPFILLSMVQLSLPEALAVACCGVLAQNLSDTQTASRFKQTALGVSITATVIATADFTFHSLIPGSLRNETLLLLIASIALFFANTFPAAIVQRLRDSKRLGQTWRDSYFWSFPYYLVAAIVANALRTAGAGVSLESALLVLPAIYIGYRYYRVQKSQLREKERYATEIAALHLRAIEGLALAVEARDNLNTRGHLRRVQVYALGMARELGLGEREMEALHAAALLHDIGKLAVPDHILMKPGKLTPEEFARMKVHPLVGAEIVEQVQFPYSVAPIVRAHHEKFDGSGYPVGLKGEEIPFGSRILSVADCLDAMTTDREYRKALPLDDAVHWIVSESGKSFDPTVVESLKRCYRDLELAACTAADQLITLSTQVAIEKGRTTGAGLDLCDVSGLPGAKPADFLGSIAAARREGKMLLEVLQGVGASLNLADTLQRVEDHVRPLVPYDAMAVLERRGNALTTLHAAGANRDMLLALQIPLGEGVTGWVAQNGRPLVNGNPNVDPGFRCESDAGLNACLALPLEGPGGFSGVVALYRRDKEGFSRDDLRILADVGPRIAAAVDNALRFREMEIRSNIDGVTELPNARLMTQFLEAELDRSKRQKQSLCVTICGLTGLSSFRLNSGRRHGADELLRNAAKAMKQSCRKYDQVARIAEDRFALILPGMTPRDMSVKASGLEAMVATITGQAGASATVHLAIGSAFYPEDADGSKPLLAIAESRMEQSAGDLTKSMLALEAETAEHVPNPAALKVAVEQAVSPVTAGGSQLAAS